jgi:hypothetical protein
MLTKCFHKNCIILLCNHTTLTCLGHHWAAQYKYNGSYLCHFTQGGQGNQGWHNLISKSHRHFHPKTYTNTTLGLFFIGLAALIKKTQASSKGWYFPWYLGLFNIKFFVVLNCTRSQDKYCFYQCFARHFLRVNKHCVIWGPLV